ncbi:MAG: hypothetical protein PWP23_1359 [Candidatus Sumerlaeota bacterium]|nr:hypothetical protein [Candidatus Sumerlaeota bacterium]
MKVLLFSMALVGGVAAAGSAWTCEPCGAAKTAMNDPAAEATIESPEEDSTPGTVVAGTESVSRHTMREALEDAPEFAIKAPLVTLAEARVVGEDRYRADVAGIPLLQGMGSGGRGKKESVLVDVPLLRLLSIDAKAGEDGEAETVSLEAGELLWANLFSAKANIVPQENGTTLENAEWRMLDAGLVTLAAKDQKPDGWEFNVGRVLWARLWENGVDGDATFVHLGNKLPGTVMSVRTSSDPQDEQYTKLLKFPLVSLFESEHDGDSGKQRLLDVTLASLYKADQDKNGTTASVLNLPLGTALLKTESDSKGGHEFRFLRLPILGSVFGHKSDGDGASATKLLFVPISHID